MDPFPKPDLYVLVRLLETVRTSELRRNRTQLQIASGMNYTQFRRYLELALTHGLLVLDEGKPGSPTVELTPKGYDALMFLVRGMREALGPPSSAGRR